MNTRHRLIHWGVSVAMLAVMLAPAHLSGSQAPAFADAALAPGSQARFDPAFLRQVLQAPAEASFRFLVTLAEQADLSAIPASLSRVERRAAVVARLKETAGSTQARLDPLLSSLKEAGHLQQVQPFWVWNGLALTGDRTALFLLAQQAEVSSIRPNRWQQWVTQPSGLPGPPENQPGLDWGIRQIRADQVWDSLQIDGANIVVAAVDSGVDWQHPALQSAYRGWRDGLPIHTGNWYDATGAGAVYPVDSLGHGTHVMGLITGQGGIGAAPGARWIAVRAFDSSGFGLDSWIHAAFQWLLAPAGNPALAPDVVNNSWSNPSSGSREFLPDVQALRAAGILSVFAAGNLGPSPSTIGMPASYLESLAVGASDYDDQVASFSSRGPSPFGGIKPEIAAPGVNLLSSLPGGSYGLYSGTSMATPLVVGTAALVLEVSPALTPDQVTYILTSTAVPAGATWPNPDTGWGRLDALSAVVSVLNPGYLEGVVTGLGVGPLAGATVRAAEHGGGAVAATRSGADGRWSLALSPGLYDVEATFFGFAPATAAGLSVVTGTVTYQNLVLSPLPTGEVTGRITASQGGQPLEATIRVEGTLVTATADADGIFGLWLPAGTYSLTAEAWGYRLGRSVAQVAIGQITQVDLALDSAPSLLLVDSGAWYYGSAIDHFRTALADQDYLYHDWRVKTLPQDTPTITDLMPYDGVIWSSPLDSPGYIMAGEVISSYLASGRSLLLSGQDVGYWDSGASGLVYSAYYNDMVKANLLFDDAESTHLTGSAGGAMEGISLTLNGPDSARNQTNPDSVLPASQDHASPLFEYDTVGNGGLATGLCLPYRSAYLSFGLEGISGQANRSEVMGRTLDWLVSPRLEAGLELRRTTTWSGGSEGGFTDGSHLVAPAGAIVTHTFRLRNTGEAGVGDTYSLTLAGANWPTAILTPTVALGPCAAAGVAVRVEIPAGTPRDQADQAVLTVRSTVSPSLVTTATLITRTPAFVLLVDDDRWYPQEASYEAALEASGFSYDRYDVRPPGGTQPGSPPTKTLALYPIVVWFTGYDWFSPITDQEAGRLQAYLDGGGRLFLSSQDALYYQADSSLSRGYLGVLAHQEDVTPTIAYGADGSLGLRGSMPLDYPFRNFSDGLVPVPSASSQVFNDQGWVMGLAHTGVDWKTTFFSFPFEALPETARPPVMDRVVGWLSWLGASEFQASRRSIVAGTPTTLTFTATLRNDGPVTVTAALTNPLPAALNLITPSLAGGIYHGGAVHWQGALVPGGEHSLRYSGLASQTLTNTASLSYAEHRLTFERLVQVWAGAPDLGPSELGAQPAAVLPGQAVSYTLFIRNSGPADAADARAAWTLPAKLTVLTDTLQASSGSPVWSEQVVRWQGAVGAGETVTVSLVGLTPAGLEPGWLSSAAVLDDRATEIVVRGHILALRPAQLFLPVLVRY